MSNKWEKTRIGNIVNPISTINPKQTPHKKFTYIDVSSICRKTFKILEPKTIIGSEAPSRARRQVHTGDVLFATIRPSLQRIAIVPPELNGTVCSTGFFVLKPTPNILEKFLFYYLFTASFLKEMSYLERGTSYPAVSDSDVRNHIIAVPPLSEQKRIVAILDEVFAGIDTAIENTKKNIEHAQELFDSKFNKFFKVENDSWSINTLQELLDKNWITSHLDGNHGGDYPRKHEFIDSGVPYLSANCLNNGYVDFSKAKYLSNTKANKLKKGIAKDNDVLFAHNATVGPTAILKTNESKVILSTSLTYYRCNKEFINPKYLLLYMRSKDFSSQYELVMRQSTRNQVPITKQRTFLHKIPSMKIQNKIIPQLDKLNNYVEKAIDFYSKKHCRLIELRQSVLHKAFTGELTKNPDNMVKEVL